MSRAPRVTAARAREAAEKALDPLASAIKRAAQRRDGRQAAAAAGPAAPAPASPLAVPFPVIGEIGGVELGTGSAGLYRHEREDVLVMRFAEGATAAGVFTRNQIGAAPVDWCRRQLQAGGGENVRLLVVNAGGANAFTGKPGADAARRVASAAAKRFGCRQRDVLMASTGVIGVVLDDAKIAACLPEIEARLRPDAWREAAAAMMTTDTFPKGAVAVSEIDGVPVRIAGIAKGSGMVAPDMATMLGFIATDAALSPHVLQTLLGLYVRNTFNSVTVDGDTSTNDCVLLFATGASGAPPITRPGDRRLADFRAELEALMLDLAHQLVRDGEGARKFVKVTVSGAETAADARKIARTIAESPLVKTAIAGEDANWGRVVMAVGRAGAPIDRDRISVRFGDLVAAHEGAVSPGYDEAAMSAYMKRDELEIAVDVGAGRASAVVWTCDLTKRYVEINGDYRS